MREALFLVSSGILCAQTIIGAESGIGVLFRIPVARQDPFRDVLQNTGGPRRQPGFQGSAGFYLRHLYRPRRFVEVGIEMRAFQVVVGETQEQFLYGQAPIRLGWQIDTSAQGWWVWGGIAGSLLWQAHSKPSPTGIYRFSDYFARSQLHLIAGVEKILSPRWQVGLSAGWDLTSAWDRVLFQSYRSLARHLWLSPYVRHTLWRLP